MLPPGDDLDLALAARLQPLEDFVLHLHVPGEVVLAGLQHGARGRDRVAAALHLDRVEVGPVRHVVVRVDLALHQIARLEVDERVGPGADRLDRLAGASRDLAPLYGSNRCLGIIMPYAPTKASAQNGVGFLNSTLDRVVVDLARP